MRIGLVVCLVTVLVVAGRRGAPEKGGSFRLSGSFFAQCLEGRTRNEMYWGGDQVPPERRRTGAGRDAWDAWDSGRAKENCRG